MRYRLQRHDGTDCSATMVPITVLRMVPIQRYRQYYLISIKKEESARFGATCVLAEVVTMVYLFAVLILSFLLTGDFFLPYTSGRTRIIIGIIGCFLPWPVIYLHYNKKRINALVEKYQDNRYNTKYSDKAVLSLSYIVPTVGLILMLLLYQFR